MTSIDLNADLGEGMGTDEDLLDIVSSASIACGGHAGDAPTIRHILRICKARGVRAGAHPGYADPKRFGRFRVVMPLDQLLGQIRSQLFLVRFIADEVGIPLSYVKLHGALANMAAEEPAVMALCLAAIEGLVQDMAVLAIDNSVQVEVAEALGYRTIREAYADRAYQPDGLLVPRQMPGAVLHDPVAIAARAVRLAEQNEIVAADESLVHTQARSLCIHGDTPDAVAIARAVKDALAANGVEIRAAL